VLVIRDLVKVYAGGVTALSGVSLDIDAGMFGLLGPNGAGKSTLMRVLAGLLEPTSGSVILDGDDLVARPERVWPKLGFLPQEFGFYPHLTGAAMLDFLLTLKGVDGPRGRRALVAELLERVNLAHAASRRVREYSGGMRQRLGIAQAIAGDPRLLIVDEPTAGLDPEERQRFYGLLAELARDRIVILSTHIVEDVAVLCRRLALLDQGRVLLQTTPAALRDTLAGRVWEGACDPDSLAALRSLPTSAACVTQTAVSEGALRARVFVASPDDADFLSPGFRPVTPTLEDAYLAVMRAGVRPPADTGS
jgi:ABC-type multidrug transport system ATPase subunit